MKMKLEIYSIYDFASKTYNAPYYQKTDEAALQHFVSLTNDENSLISKFPDQFALFNIGIFNDESGFIETYDQPKRLGLAKDFLSKDVQKELLLKRLTEFLEQQKED